MTLAFLFLQKFGMIVGHVYTVKSFFIIKYQYEDHLF